MDFKLPPIGPPARTPGPFGPVIDLLPKEQSVESVRHDTPVSDAIERMTDRDYSQVPVIEGNRVVGLFSWRSFGKHVGRLSDLSTEIQNIPVRECLAEAQFLPPGAFIDTGIDWTDRDCILVGTPENVHGLLAIYDVVGRLHDFGEAFFLIHEVEHLLRDMLTEAIGFDRLTEMIGSMSVPPSYRVQPTSLTDLTFSMYGDLACSRSRWPEFEPMFYGDRVSMKDSIDSIAKIRNVIFHFKRPVTVDDVDELRRFRTRLVNQRDYFHRQQTA